MPRPIGPTIPRWQLGEQLNRLRDAAGISLAAVAERLDCSPSKVTKIEAGLVGVVRAELDVMLDLYGADDAMRASLVELQKLGKQRGWWSKFGQVPAPFATFLGLESAATAIKVFEALVVHGLLQTESYAYAVSESVSMDPTEAARDRQVRLRMERQERVLGEEPPEYWVIFDESVLHRVVGSREIMAEQLRHLAKMAKRYPILVIPFGHGGHPGTLGAFTIFEFEEERHSPVVYVEGQAGHLYLEKPEDIARCNVAYNHMTAAALSRPESAKLIAAVARQMAAAARS